MPETEVEDLLRQLAPQVLGAVVRRYGHFEQAEDATQEALIAAAAQWPAEGLPAHPRGWLITVASRRLTDLLRADQARQRRADAVARWVLPEDGLAPAADLPPTDHDDTLILLFMCCHPALTPASQIALTLRAVGGLATAEIARAFLVPETTMTRRISRAKQQIKASMVPFRMPAAAERGGRLAAVLHVLYLIFTEGYASTSGPSLHRGELIPMAEQDRTLWNGAQIAEGVDLITTALARGPAGPYQLQAAIAAVHDEAPTADATDWPQIAALYELLMRLSDNPVVRLNQAVAVAMVRGPRAGLMILDGLADDERMAGSHQLAAVRAHLLEMAGEPDAARAAYLDAAT